MGGPVGRSRRHIRGGWKIAIVSVLALIAFGVAAMALMRPVPVESRTFTPTPLPTTSKPLTFAAVGDSITEANSLDFARGNVGTGSWVSHVDSAGIRFVGGWADGGAPTPTILQNVKPVTADVLLVLAGTNDLGRRPVAESEANIREIVTKAGTPRAVILAVPPFDKDPQLATDYNTAMKAYAASMGWEWVDPMGAVRNGDRWAAGMTTDGTHPTPEAARLIGESVSQALTGNS